MRPLRDATGSRAPHSKASTGLLQRPARSLAILAILVAAGCGGTRKTGGGGSDTAAPALPPADPAALRHFDRGLRAIKLGGPEAYIKARPRFEKAVAADKNLWEAHHNLGAIAFVEGDDEAAVEAFSAALEINPVNVATRLARAEVHRRLGNTKKARDDYRAAIKVDADNARAYARLASLHRSTRDYSDGLEVIREALVEVGGAPEIYVEQGLLYLAQGRDGLAELVLLKAVELNKQEPAIYNALALVSMARGKDQEAFNYFDTASNLDPDYLDARFNRASVFMDSGNYAGAREELSYIVSKRPDDLEARVALGVAHRGLGEYDQARKVWEGVIDAARRRSRVSGDALWNLAVLEMDFVKNEKKAAQALRRYKSGAGRKHSKRKAADERISELEI
jgi:tetratricopeptide (TPR) repeat protein